MYVENDGFPIDFFYQAIFSSHRALWLGKLAQAHKICEKAVSQSVHIGSKKQKRKFYEFPHYLKKFFCEVLQVIILVA